VTTIVYNRDQRERMREETNFFCVRERMREEKERKEREREKGRDC